MENKQLWTDLTDEQCEQVVGGTGRNNAGVNAWAALFEAGFVPGHNAHSNPANGAVVVPTKI